MNDLKTFQESNNLKFQDQSLLLRALTHASYLNEHPKEGLEDNERLEFLGDAVLDFISGELLYHRFPEAPEGYLTRLRAALVRTETLADFAKQCKIGDVLLLGHGEAENGGRTRNGNLCAAFEAITGALYLDQGIEIVREFVLPFFENTLEEIVRDELDKDPKSKLQEWTQANLGLTPSYQTINSQGPDHQKIFTVGVFIGDKIYAQGVGTSKQTAAQQAAEQALELLSKSGT
jgi:ribonuclease-3